MDGWTFSQNPHKQGKATTITHYSVKLITKILYTAEEMGGEREMCVVIVTACVSPTEVLLIIF